MINKQLVPISFSGGLNTKTDYKQLQIQDFLCLENAIFTNPNLLQKRQGLTTLNNIINHQDTTITSGASLSVFQDQLLLFSGTSVYSKNHYNNSWSNKGNLNSIINTTNKIIASGDNYTAAQAASINNTQAYIYLNTSDNTLRYSIVDSNTHNFIQSNKILTTNATNPQVNVVNNNYVFTFIKNSTLIAATLATNALYATPNQITIKSQVTNYDITRSYSKLDSTTFDRLFIATASTSQDPVLQVLHSDLTLNTIYENPDPLTHPITHLSITTAVDMSDSYSIASGTVPFIVYYQNQLKLSRINLSVGVAHTTTLNHPTTNLKNISFAWSQEQYTQQLNFKLFTEHADRTNNPTLAYCYSSDLQVETKTSEISAAIQNTTIKKGIGIYSKAFVFNNKFYIITIHQSEFQSVYFLTNDKLEVQSKANKNNAGNLITTPVNVFSDTTFINLNKTSQGLIQIPNNIGIFTYPTMLKGKLESENLTTYYNYQVVSTTSDFVSDNHFQTATINDNLYIGGSVLKNYDNNIITEAGFHLYPEQLNLDSSKLIINEISNYQSLLLFVPASRLPNNSIITLVVGSGIYNFWFSVNNSTTAPTIPGNNIKVNIQDYFTSSEVALAFTNAINKNIINLVTANINQNGVELNGVADQISILTNINEGNIQPGRYLYTAVWRYTDNAGRIHRSATAIPQTITTNTNTSITISVPLLSPTEKTNVVLEIYRTFAGGTDYRRVTSLSNPIYNIQSNDPNKTTLSFVDTQADNQIAANELLYTTGGVLDNDSPPPCSLITICQNRIFIAGLDDPQTIQYTKEIDPSDVNFVAGFSDYLTVQMDSRGGKITAIATMDDKLIVFKESQIFLLVGQGASNTGIGGFDITQQISTDTGCDNPNSVVLTPNGLMFKSKKGIYLLDRSLQVSYIGAPVEDYNNLTISSSILHNIKNQVRFVTTNGLALVFDYFVNKWTSFTNYEAVDCDIWQDKFVLLRSNGNVCVENNEYVDYDINNNKSQIQMTIELSDIAIAGIVGFQRLYRIAVLGEYKGKHKLNLELAYNYSPAYTSSLTFDATSLIGTNVYGEYSPYGSHVYGGEYLPYMFRAHVKNQKCSAVRIKLTDNNEFNEGLTLSGIVLQVGVNTPNLYPQPFNKQLGFK